MAKSGKLRTALDRHQGRNIKLEKQRKQEKTAEKRKRAKPALSQNIADEDQDEGESVEEATAAGDDAQEDATADWETEEDDDDDGEDDSEDSVNGFDVAALEDSDSDVSDDDDDDVIAEPPPLAKSRKAALAAAARHAEEDDDVLDEDEEDIPLSDLGSVASEDKGDLIPHQRLTINNTAALLAAVKRIALPTSMSFSEHQSHTTDAPVAVTDVDDDLNRELAFYQQSLTSVKQARALLKKEGAPFSRPTDYFAEMVKSDEHMGRVKQKLVDAAASKKASADARKQRDLKKFGKAVQVEKQRERDRLKRETLEKINSLKRKRSGADLTNTNEDDMFDVALEDAATTERKDRDARRQQHRGKDGKPNTKRQKKDEKFGFGGKKRHKKSGDAFSSADMSGYSAKRMKSDSFGAGKGKPKVSKRPGKSRRAKTR